MGITLLGHGTNTSGRAGNLRAIIVENIVQAQPATVGEAMLRVAAPVMTSLALSR
jgi:hypothetical protein